jgi:hypothetical protein
LTSVPFGDAVEEGELTAAFFLTFTVQELSPYKTLWAVVDDEEASNECEEGDNSVSIDLAGICP